MMTWLLYLQLVGVSPGLDMGWCDCTVQHHVLICTTLLLQQVVLR
jgi:hypothetical protein